MNTKLKKLLFLSQHRGTKENDLLLGSFAEIFLLTLSESHLEDFEKILSLPDPDLFEWISEKKPLPQEYALNPVFASLKTHYQTLLKRTSPGLKI